MPGLEKYHGQDVYLTEALSLEINASIKEAVEEKKPFFAYMSHYALHAPFHPDEESLTHPRRRPFRSSRLLRICNFNELISGFSGLNLAKQFQDLRCAVRGMGVHDSFTEKVPGPARICEGRGNVYCFFLLSCICCFCLLSEFVFVCFWDWFFCLDFGDLSPMSLFSLVRGCGLPVARLDVSKG